jgi:hypothetical protein
MLLGSGSASSGVGATGLHALKGSGGMGGGGMSLRHLRRVLDTSMACCQGFGHSSCWHLLMPASNSHAEHSSDHTPGREAQIFVVALLSEDTRAMGFGKLSHVPACQVAGGFLQEDN